MRETIKTPKNSLEASILLDSSFLTCKVCVHGSWVKGSEIGQLVERCDNMQRRQGLEESSQTLLERETQNPRMISTHALPTIPLQCLTVLRGLDC